jgi:hypothetical protein
LNILINDISPKLLTHHLNTNKTNIKRLHRPFANDVETSFVMTIYWRKHKIKILINTEPTLTKNCYDINHKDSLIRKIDTYKKLEIEEPIHKNELILCKIVISKPIDEYTLICKTSVNHITSFNIFP